LKIIFLLCDPIVTINTLVSCVIALEEVSTINHFDRH
jgi:hypothetical protein